MTKKEIIQTLLNTVEPTLLPLGFKRKRTSNGCLFRRTTDFGFNEIPVMVWSYNPIFFVSLGFAIRIDAINQIAVHYGNYVVHEPDETITLGAGIEDFGYVGDHKIRVEFEEELNTACKILNDLLLTKGLPFLEKFTSVSSVDQELNRMDRPRNLYGDDIVHRPIFGIVAASLNKNSEFEFWADFYRKQLVDDLETEKQKFEQLLSYLQNLSEKA